MKKLLFATLLALSVTAHAEIKEIDVKMACDTDHSILEALANKYDEHPLVVGKTEDGKMLMILSVNTAGTGWTVLGVQDETTCIFVAGKDLKVIEATKTNSDTTNTTKIKY